ncbi:8730_t:CDS:2 [Cetraspora pellucida]|uniref:8730_t:CDS:1 n=2 Tax=Gigasporaceae TaxID=36753 RepID=A0ACA9KRB6_9GLOM|nr:8730_t:CDS:2 [Cetraspora pellucida]
MDPYCNGCKTFKSCHEFMGYDARGAPKQFKTCDKCRPRLNKKPKRPLESDDDVQLHNEYEVIDIEFLSEAVTTLLESTSQELHLNCKVGFTLKSQSHFPERTCNID